MRLFWAWLLAFGILQGCSGYSVEVQISTLGHDHFTVRGWAGADQVGRGRMVGSFLSQYPVTQLTRAEIRDLLGEPTGAIGRDDTLCYFVGPTTVVSQYGRGYLLIFFLDQGGKVRAVDIVPPVTIT